MCGICGYIGRGEEQILDRMLKQMIHRGPDDEGKYVGRNVGLGVRRLSVIDVAGGRQPATNEDRSVWVALNGEIYNYRELRAELASKGHQFASQSDTEVIVHLYEEYGEEMVPRLRGMFAIALWDDKNGIFLLIRDRLGIKPLYYAASGDGNMLFASELGALGAVMPQRSICPAAIVKYLTFLYIPAPETIFQGIRQLMPGHMMKIKNGNSVITGYFDVSGLVKPDVRASEAELQEEFRATLKQTVESHLVSDVPLGLLLSGGLDSGSILAMMRSVTGGEIRTFTIGYSDNVDMGFNEAAESRAIANKFGAQHTEELLSPDITDLVPKVVAAMGEPFADSSSIVTYLIAEVARRSVTVALSGIGGDELFGGYPRYMGIRIAPRYEKVPPGIRRLLADCAAPFLSEQGSHRDQFGRLKRFLQSGFLPVGRQYANWISFLPHDWKAPVFADGILEGTDARSSLELFESIFNNWPSPKPADRAMGLDLRVYLPDDLLKMADRMSMAHSLELRVPFCDHELLSLALRIPEKTRFAGMRLKGFMRDALETVLPRHSLKGPKRGFMVPLTRWLREDLRDMAHDLLSAQRIGRGGYLAPAYVAWLIGEHESGRRNFADQIYALLVLEIWLGKLQSNSANKAVGS